MRRLLAALVLLGACAAPVTAPPTSTPTSTPPSTTSTTAIPAPTAQEETRVEECTTAQALPWALLCRAFPLVLERHVDSPSAEDLAAAAVAGVRRLADADPVESGSDSMRCLIPHPAFEPVCDAIAERHHGEALPVDALVEAAVAGMFRLGLDPFSAYVPAGYPQGTAGSGHVFSIGLVVGARDGDGAVCGPLGGVCRLRVLALQDFQPAERQGVVLGDVIVEIEGEPVEGLSEAEAVARLHRPPGTDTRITVERAGGGIVKVLRHEDIRLDPVEFAMVDTGVAYLRVNDFSQESAQAVGRILEDDSLRGARALLLDLRDNPGGLVAAAQAVASQFLDGGVVIVEETRRGEMEVPVLAGGLASGDLRVVVLTNRGTASAAEVVAAALQARSRAQVVGQPTFGKNLVQEVFDAPDGGEFRISVARWRAPDGTDVGVRGVIPDVLVEDGDVGSDAVFLAALASLGG